MSDLALEAAELARIRSEAEAIVAEHIGRSVDQIRTDTDRALVLTRTDAISYGIVDDVLSVNRSGREHDRAVAAGPIRPNA